MDTNRILHAYCQSCSEPTPHAVPSADRSVAVCHACGDEQQLVVPLEG